MYTHTHTESQKYQAQNVSLISIVPTVTKIMELDFEVYRCGYL